MSTEQSEQEFLDALGAETSDLFRRSCERIGEIITGQAVDLNEVGTMGNGRKLEWLEKLSKLQQRKRDHGVNDGPLSQTLFDEDQRRELLEQHAGELIESAKAVANLVGAIAEIQWTSTEDGLPGDRLDSYLCFLRRDKATIRVVEFCDGEWRLPMTEFVTHWAPMPAWLK